MSKRMVFTSVALIMMVILSACSGLTLGSATSTATPIGQISAASAAQTVAESKVGIGILKLEGTSQAVTTDQASNLLFLWKGVKALTSDQSSSKFELAALYNQIEESLTAEQVQAINQLNLTQSDIVALQNQYGARLAQGGAPTGGTSTTSSSTKSSTSQSQTFDAGFAGGGPGGGPGGDIPAALTGNGTVSLTTSTTPSSTTSQKSTTAAAVKPTVDYNAMFVNAVISLLEQRVGA